MNVFKAAVIVCSDRSFRGEYEDTAGRAIHHWLEEHSFECSLPTIIPDDKEAIAASLRASLAHDVLIFVGGTGLSPRDITPQTIAAICDYEIPGVGEYLRAESLKITSNALLSRCGAWVVQQKLVLALPGSKRAALEMMNMLADMLPRLLRALRNDCTHEEHGKHA